MAGRPKKENVNFHRRVTPDEKKKLTKYLEYLREQTLLELEKNIISEIYKKHNEMVDN